MPNYSLVVNSKFNPFTYEELAAPLRELTLAHQLLEDAYSLLEDKANTLLIMANNEYDKDSDSAKLYQAYANQLSLQAEVLAKQGLSNSSRQDLVGMKRRYTKEMLPIQEAFGRRAKDIEELKKGRLAGIVYDTNAYETSIDKYVKDSNLTHASADSNAGYKRVYTAALSLAKELQDWGRGKSLDSYTNTLMQRHGYTRETVNQAINDIYAALNGQPNEGGSGVLQDILRQEMRVSGVDQWSSQAAKNDYYNRIAPALYGAVGQTNISTFANQGAIAELQARKARTAAKGSGSSKKTRLPDVTSYFFKKDRERIPELLDSSGKLKSLDYRGIGTPLDLTSRLFRNGKFSKPKVEGISLGGPSLSAMDYYNEINDVLLNNGYTLKAIDNMSKKDVEKSLNNIYEANSSDALGRDVYRFALDSEATKYLASKLTGRKLPVRPIESMREGMPLYGEDTELELQEGDAVDILYDPKTRAFSTVHGGEYYELPKGMISNDMYTLLDSYSNADTQLKIKLAEAIRDTLLAKYLLDGNLTERELAILNQADQYLIYWDDIMGTAGDDFVKYVGKTKVNL